MLHETLITYKNKKAFSAQGKAEEIAKVHTTGSKPGGAPANHVRQFKASPSPDVCLSRLPEVPLLEAQGRTEHVSAL